MEEEALLSLASPFADYLAGRADAFFAGDFRDATVRARVCARVARPLTPAVATALGAQNARLGAAPARDAHLAALAAGAAAVVTGQQCGLFLGPLFTLYKAASAVVAARALTAETGRPVVPVFWVQNEDHDLPEIAVTHVPRAHGAPLALQLPASATDRVSVAHRALPDEIIATLDALRAEIGNLPDAAAHLARLARHYRPGAGWAEAFTGVLAELFADAGLVFVDPRDPVLAAAAAPIHRRALTDAAALADGLVARGCALAAAGYAETVHVRPGAPLSFFHPDGPTGPRHRLQIADGGFAELGGGRRWGVAELLAALDADPRAFSTSALLRPIVQDALLPTAVYVGGPGEVAYFAQLAPLYAAFDVTMPLVVPRARLRVLDERTLAHCARLDVTPDDAVHPVDDAARALDAHPADAVVADGLDEAALAQALVAPFDAALDRLRARITATGPGLDKAVDKTRGTVADAVAKLARKIAAAHRQRDRTRADELQQIRWALAPHGVPQERYYGLPYFAARFGERAFVERVLGAIVPFDPAPRDLVCAQETRA